MNQMHQYVSMCPCMHRRMQSSVDFKADNYQVPLRRKTTNEALRKSTGAKALGDILILQGTVLEFPLSVASSRKSCEDADHTSFSKCLVNFL